MRAYRRVMLVVLVAGLFAGSASAAEPDASLKSENAELKTELKLLRTQLGDATRRLDALEGRLGVAPDVPVAETTAKSKSSSAALSTASGSDAASGADDRPSGGMTVGTALMRMLPGPVTAPTSLPAGYGLMKPPEQQGVMIPRMQGPPKIFLPDIGLVGDFVFQQNNLRKGDPRYDPSQNKLLVRDVELIFASPVDPYTFAQIEIAGSPDEGFSVEQAYLLFDKHPLLQALPLNIGVKVGQFRPRFGLINQMETFALPMVNRPNALANFIGNEGLIEPGIDLSTYIPNPWDADLRLDANMLAGVNDVSWNHRDGQNFDFAYIASLTYSRDLFDSSSMTTGLSFAEGPGGGGAAFLEDAFMQVQYAPDPRNIFTWNIEGILTQRKGVGDHGMKRGVYTLFDYNFALLYHVGLLIDWADRPNVASGSTLGFSPILTYFVSDGTRLRLQYTYTTPSGPERPLNAVFLQATFSFGNLKHLD
ncbi:MAG: hypothetical protein ACREQF_05175 [Candidatus Binataceae bacterium]